MVTTLLLALPEPVQQVPGALDCDCPTCGQPLANGKVEVGRGKSVNTVFCPANNCDLRPFTFRERTHG